jgi:hypothetical protein
VTAIAPRAALTPADLAEFVDQLAVLLQSCPGGTVEVPGDEPLAGLLRERLGPRVSAVRAQSPAVVIDTSGSPEGIKDALRRLDDLGTLVLTRGGGDVSLNLYADLHLRSLSIVAVATPEGLWAADQAAAGGQEVSRAPAGQR